MNEETGFTAGLIIGIGAVLLMVVLFFMFALPPIGRYQERENRNQKRTQALRDANNEVTLNNIQIRTQEQKVKIERQRANIRFIRSTGIRRAQDEIAATLTPLYVQFEMIDALKAVAASGRNATVVYIPTGSNGLPIVNATGNGLPTSTPKD